MTLHPGTTVTDPHRWLTLARGRYERLSQLATSESARPQVRESARISLKLLAADIRRVRREVEGC